LLSRAARGDLQLSPTRRSSDLLPDEILEALRPFLRRRYVRREEFLFQQDEEMHCVYFPETAVLSELHGLEDGRMVEIAITGREGDRKSTRLNSSHVKRSYAVYC